MGLLSNMVSAVGRVVTGLTNFFTDMFLTPPLKATLQHLRETELKTLRGEIKTLKAESLWDKSGAVIMAVRRPG
uniref:Uncharacterized protein n=2 Tax=Monopterus albus TaxID=43700 RepID=A0A3Q3IZN5_MONAL